MLFLINKPLLGRKSFLTIVGSKSLGVYVIHVLVMSMSMTLMTIFNLENLKEFRHWEMVYLTFVFVTSYVSYNLIQYIKGRVLTKIKKLGKKPETKVA